MPRHQLLEHISGQTGAGDAPSCASCASSAGGEVSAQRQAAPRRQTNTAPRSVAGLSARRELSCGRAAEGLSSASPPLPQRPRPHPAAAGLAPQGPTCTV